MWTTIAAVLRHLLTAGGGALASYGVIDAGEVESAVGAVMTVIGLVWSILEKQRAKKALEKAIAAPAGQAE